MATARDKNLVNVEYAWAQDREGKRRLSPHYAGREIIKWGIVAYFWQKDDQETKMKLVPREGRRERIKEHCHQKFRDLFGPLPSPSQEESLSEESSLPLGIGAKEIENLCLYLSLMTKGKEDNWVDGATLEGGRINWAFVRKVRWLYLVFQGDSWVKENDNDINNGAFLQTLVSLKDYLEQNNFTLEEAITRAEAMTKDIKEEPKLEDYKDL